MLGDVKLWTGQVFPALCYIFEEIPTCYIRHSLHLFWKHPSPFHPFVLFSMHRIANQSSTSMISTESIDEVA